MDTIKKLSSWVFSKKVLPYLVILAIDTLIVFVSCLFTWWVMNRTPLSVDNVKAVLLTSLLFSMLSWIGARIFRTYSGVLRYSSFVDLLKLVYANAITLGLSIIVLLAMNWQHVWILSALTVWQTISAFIIATMMMWALRTLVKLLFDAFNTDTHALRVLIYGALTGGVGIAKNIRAQSPAQFELCGFISHEARITNMKLLGVRVYAVDDDLAAIIRRDRIQAIIMSPLRETEFRANQALQDLFIGKDVRFVLRRQNGGKQ